MSEQSLENKTNPIDNQVLQTIDKLNKSRVTFDLRDGEFEDALVRLAERHDHDNTMRLFEAFYSYMLRVSEKDRSSDEIRRDALWRTDSTAALADARRSGKEDILMVYGNPYRPISKTQKFFRDAVNYHPIEPQRQTG